MAWYFIIAWAGAWAGAFALTEAMRRFAIHYQVLDVPGTDPRHIHTRPIPLLGGVAVFLSFAIVLSLVAWFAPDVLLGKTLHWKNLIGLLAGGLVLVVGGTLDDKYDLKPRYQFFISLLAVGCVLLGGIGVREITNPFGGTFNLMRWDYALTTLWLLVMIYTTKLLDGLDGLATGITSIGALIIFFLATMTQWYQPNIAFISLVLAGAFLGFLPWNWNPARVFLGNGGSMVAGFLLGVLSIIAGSKIATTLLVIGIPLLDMLWVIARRLIWEHKPLSKGDRKHLHFRLLDAGFSHRSAVLILYALSALFGVAALFLQSKEKLIALMILVLAMVVLAVYVVIRYNKKRSL